MALPLRVTKNGADTFDKMFEVLLGGLQLPASQGGDLVELRATGGFSERPLRSNPFALLHSVKGWIEGALFDAEEIVRGALDVQDDAIAVKGAGLRKGFE